MTFAETMQTITEMEASVQRMIRELCGELRDRVVETAIPGVRQVSENPKVSIVRFSALSSLNWSPEYYIPACQAEAVAHKVGNCKTIEAVCKSVEEMLMQKRVKMGNGYNDFTYLNDTTLQIIRSSEIGRWVSNQKKSIS